MAETEFVGLAPWSDNFPRIDFETPQGVVDLHNNGVFEELTFLVDIACLVLRFRYSPDWRKLDEEGYPVELEFREVRNLKFEQAEDYDPKAARTLEGIVRDVADENSEFLVDFGDLQCRLSAAAIVLRVAGDDGSPPSLLAE